MIKSANREVLMSFMRSKDDNLLVLMGGMVISIWYNKSVKVELIQAAREVCPHKLRKQVEVGEQEEEKKEEDDKAA